MAIRGSQAGAAEGLLYPILYPLWYAFRYAFLYHLVPIRGQAADLICTIFFVGVHLTTRGGRCS